MDFIYTQPNENLQLIDASLCAIPALAGPFALIVLLSVFIGYFENHRTVAAGWFDL